MFCRRAGRHRRPALFFSVVALGQPKRYSQFMATNAEYVQAAMRSAHFEQKGAEWFGSIPQLPGLWSSGATLEEARDDLRDALHAWIDVHVNVGGHRLADA
jgi:predicted RNase H-like HicB family nuclease